MAGAIIEVKYFNTFLLKQVNNSNDPIWNGSFGIPESVNGGYPIVPSPASSPNQWVIEEYRIRGGYNNTNVDYGAKAYIVEDEPRSGSRPNSLIYSGVFNSRTGINQTNVFSVAEDITKTADPANGSIQKLYAEDTNLTIFQELKVSRALIDKDAIYSAEGGGSVTSSNLVIGVIQPYTGEYGISKNPESFAVYGYRKYFSDVNNNVMLRLSKDGLTEISSYGMKDFFRDKLSGISNNFTTGKAIGGYDIYNSEYVVSLQKENSGFETINFDEKAQGWVSRFSYDPDQMFSLRNNFYTIKTISGDAQLWRHYDNSVARSSFYNRTGANAASNITFIFNPNPTNSKSFQTIAYEGSSGWQVDSFVSDATGRTLNVNGISYNNVNDSTAQITSYGEGEYVLTEGSGTSLSATISNTVSLNTATFIGSAVVDSIISGIGVGPGITVISYNSTTGALVTSGSINIASGTLLTFNGYVSSQNYNTVLGTNSPALNRYYAGFTRKENKYTANIINNTSASTGEVLFGNAISGIKGFYSTVKLSTDLTTDVGGEKTLFSAESVYTMNNGY